MTDISRFDALLFDLDGVITRTATLHAGAWKDLFDHFLSDRAEERGEAFVPFDVASDYLLYVDGRRRYDGVDTFLRSRGIELPHGDPTDPPEAETVCGLGNRKNGYFNDRLTQLGVEVFDDTVELIAAARRHGRKVAVVSASENCEAILARAGLLELFDNRVTGIEAAQLNLAGKPAPDTYLKAAELLDTSTGGGDRLRGRHLWGPGRARRRIRPGRWRGPARRVRTAPQPRRARGHR
jgi:alpha,alpha-trehalase